jgi:type VI secretion system protein ImpH
LPAAVEEFVGEWVVVPEDQRWCLGQRRETSMLGRITLGARAWTRTHKFRVALGPLSASDFERMLPGSEGVEALSGLVRLYTNDEWAWELRLVLSPAVNAGMRLNGTSRLGWTTRLGAGSAPEVMLAIDPSTGATRRDRSPARLRPHPHERT